MSYNAHERSAFLANLLAHGNSQFLLVPLFVLGLGSITLGFLLSATIIMTTSPIIVSNFTKVLPLGIGLIVICMCFYKVSSDSIIKFSLLKSPKKFLTNT